MKLKPLYARIVLILALISIAWIALVPSPPGASTVLWDKLNHFIAFAVLAFLSDQAFHVSISQAIKPIAFIHAYYLHCLSLLLYATAIEIGQHFVETRYFEFQDIAADSLGLLAYFLLRFGLVRFNVKTG